MNRYVLTDDGRPVPEPDLLKWAQWFNDFERRRVKWDDLGVSRVSTVFLGVDHSWYGPPPILWETMVFGGKLDQEQDRCTGNREQAEAMHAEMVARVIEAEGTTKTAPTKEDR